MPCTSLTSSVSLSHVELNYICNRLIVLRLRVEASFLLLLYSSLQRAEKGCGAVLYLWLEAVA